LIGIVEVRVQVVLEFPRIRHAIAVAVLGRGGGVEPPLAVTLPEEEAWLPSHWASPAKEAVMVTVVA